MKLKQRPDDFHVEEISTLSPSEGPYALYRMEKRGWSTPDALAALRRRWRIEPRRISYGGLKDRHAWTVQYLTIFHGPRRDLRHHDIAVRYVGQRPSAYVSHDIEANRFRLTLRDVPTDLRPAIEARLAQLGRDGVPNYFDDQRFGSVAPPTLTLPHKGEGDSDSLPPCGEGHQISLPPCGGGLGRGESEFIARLLIQGRFEDALRLALAAPYEHDRAASKEEKRLLNAHWGEWARLKDELPRGHARSLVDYLRVHPGDFRGAVARLRPELRGLYLSAYQSHLWNRTLALWLRTRLRHDQLRPVTLRLGVVPFPHDLDEEQRRALASLRLPLLSARLKLDDADPRGEVVRATLAEEGLELKQMQIRGIREMFFSRGERAALCVPSHLTHAFAPDELHRGREALTLSFELPRGCYATLLVKAIQATHFYEPET